jgi:hypothetical protein
LVIFCRSITTEIALSFSLPQVSTGFAWTQARILRTILRHWQQFQCHRHVKYFCQELEGGGFYFWESLAIEKIHLCFRIDHT